MPVATRLLASSHLGAFPPAPDFDAIHGLIHVWWADLSRADSEVDQLLELISPAERDRAARCRVANSRRRFLVTRGLLRMLLGNYLGEHPADLPLTMGPFGKPRLSHEPPALFFNLSHSDDLAVFAVTSEREVGIDLERIHEVPEWQAISSSFFSEAEIARLTAIPESQRTTPFINAWTRHEAWLKTTGRGWGGRPPKVLPSISFCPIDPPAGFSAALAIEGPPVAVLDAGFL